jgi:superfamily II DNA helicase RecQ
VHVLAPGVTLVVSPLLALMRDQLDRLPPAVPGAMLWGGQTRQEAEQVLADVARGAVKVCVFQELIKQ